MTTTPGKKPPIDYDESEFDYGPVACALCDADLVFIDTGDNIGEMEIRHDADCPIMLAHYEKDES